MYIYQVYSIVSQNIYFFFSWKKDIILVFKIIKNCKLDGVYVWFLFGGRVDKRKWRREGFPFNMGYEDKNTEQMAPEDWEMAIQLILKKIKTFWGIMAPKRHTRYI